MMISKQVILVLTLIFITGCAVKKENPKPPNILWIIVEDMSSHFGYQGEALVTTPHIDQLAEDGFLRKEKLGTGNYYVNEKLIEILKI